jgi:bisphosphoglycerate-independent phosphoglycerate mutase (AlkP superfamily)
LRLELASPGGQELGCGHLVIGARRLVLQALYNLSDDQAEYSFVIASPSCALAKI